MKEVELQACENNRSGIVHDTGSSPSSSEPFTSAKPAFWLSLEHTAQEEVCR